MIFSAVRIRLYDFFTTRFEYLFCWHPDPYVEGLYHTKYYKCHARYSQCNHSFSFNRWQDVFENRILVHITESWLDLALVKGVEITIFAKLILRFNLGWASKKGDSCLSSSFRDAITISQPWDSSVLYHSFPTPCWSRWLFSVYASHEHYSNF